MNNNVNIGSKYLPIGTVCLLKNAKKRVMITGFVVKSIVSNNLVTYDYAGCLYPEGIIQSDKNLLFNHDDIVQVYFMGYSDAEDKLFKTKLNELVSTLDKKS